MRRILGCLALLAAPPLGAQTTAPRSTAYLFSANVEDARALWVNPAGLGVLPLATIYAEVTADQGPVTGTDWGIRQFSAGLHSRNMAVSYQRDRFVSGGSQGTWRVGAAFPLAPRMAIGTAVTFTKPQRKIDLGLRFSPARPLDVGAVLQNIGRPTIDDVEQPITGVAGFALHLAGGRLGIQSDAIGTERRPESGYDMQYHAGALYVFPGRQPLSFITAFDLENNLRISRWSLGIGIGFQAQLLAVGTAESDGNASARFQSFSLAGVARGRTHR